MKLKIGDEILVTVGKDKGRTGKIGKIFPKKNKVLVPEVNVYKRHRRPVPALGIQGGILEFSRPLPIGNVVLMCPNCKKQTRIGYLVLKDGVKVRVCRKCGKQLDKEGK